MLTPRDSPDYLEVQRNFKDLQKHYKKEHHVGYEPAGLTVHPPPLE